MLNSKAGALFDNFSASELEILLIALDSYKDTYIARNNIFEKVYNAVFDAFYYCK